MCYILKTTDDYFLGGKLRKMAVELLNREAF